MNKKRDIYGIIGLGRFGMSVAKELAKSGKTILCVDRNERKVKEILEYCEYAYVTDDLSKENLEELGFSTCKTVIVCIGEKMDISVLATSYLKDMAVPTIFAKAISEDHARILENLGAKAILPEQDSANSLAKRLLSKNIIDYISLGNDIEVTEIIIGKNMYGKTIVDLSIRSKYNLNIIALETDNRFTTKILPNYKFKENDKIVVIGEKTDILNFEKTIH